MERDIQAKVQRYIEASAPGFAHQVLSAYDAEAVLSEYEVVGGSDNECVDLSLVVGVKHPNYQGCTWEQLSGVPFGDRESAHLQRIRGAILDLEANPGYYQSIEHKTGWSFAAVDGELYCTEGVHRTVLGRYLLESLGVKPLVYGVAVRVYRRKASLAVGRQEPVQAVSNLAPWWRRLFGE